METKELKEFLRNNHGYISTLHIKYIINILLILYFY